MRIGPSGTWGDKDPEALFTYVAQQLAELDLAYLHLIEPRILGNIEDENAGPRRSPRN